MRIGLNGMRNEFLEVRATRDFVDGLASGEVGWGESTNEATWPALTLGLQCLFAIRRTQAQTA